MGGSDLISSHKVLLMLIYSWCILVILKSFVFNRSLRVMRVLIHVRGYYDLIEPIVRCLKLEFQMAGFDIELVLQTGDSNDEYCKIANLLVKDGVLAPACRLQAPDLVLHLGQSQEI